MFWQSTSATTLLLTLGLYTSIVVILYFWAIHEQPDHKLKVVSWHNKPQMYRHLLIAGGLYLFVSFLYLFAIPIGESPDEPGHLRCVEQVALDDQIPIVDPKPDPALPWTQNITSGGICYHLPLYYLLAGQIYEGVGTLAGTTIHFEFPPFASSDAAPSLFQHEATPLLGMFPEPIHLIVLRIVGIFLGFITVMTSYMLTKSVFSKGSYLPLISAILVAGWPQFVYLTRGISNDVLATALGSVVLLLLVNIGNPYRLIFAAYVSSLIILTKLSLLFVPVVVLCAIVIEWFVYKNKRQQYQKVLFISFAVWGMMGLILFANPILRLHFLGSGRSFSQVSENIYTLTYWLEVAKMGLGSGWAYFGWMNLPAPISHAYLWWGFLAIAAFMGFIYAWRGSVAKRPLLIILILWMIGAIFIFVRININRFQPQFRFILTTIPVSVIFASGGIGRLLRNRERILQFGVLTLIVFLAGYNIWLVYNVIGSAYNLKF